MRWSISVRAGKLNFIEITEIDPELEKEQNSNVTAKIAVDRLLSALKKKLKLTYSVGNISGKDLLSALNAAVPSSLQR
jgi:hypothetical protein